MKIGIPRALVTLKHLKLWTTFLEKLKVEVVLSPVTTREILDQGLRYAEDEACLPVKIAIGHALWLKDKVDKVLIPRYFSLYKNEWGCPKFFGLPDILESYGVPCVTVMVGREYESGIVFVNYLERVLMDLGEKLGKSNEVSEQAMKQAIKAQKEHEGEMEKNYQKLLSFKKEKILLVSHEYNLYDPAINLGITGMLEERDCAVIPVDWIPFKFQPRHSRWDWWMRWDFGTAMYERVKKLIKKVEGVIQITTFACGPDSFLCEFVSDICNNAEVPYMKLMFDEHTASERIRNRIEAFLESLRMRKWK